MKGKKEKEQVSGIKREEGDGRKMTRKARLSCPKGLPPPGVIILQLRLLSWLKLLCLKATNPSWMQNLMSSIKFTRMISSQCEDPMSSAGSSRAVQARS